MPSAHVIGSGPEDADGIPTVTLEDLVGARAEDGQGMRYVFARVEVFPEALAHSWRSAKTTDVEAARREALAHIAEALARLSWEESK
jgi:hypothetical protein